MLDCNYKIATEPIAANLLPLMHVINACEARSRGSKKRRNLPAYPFLQTGLCVLQFSLFHLSET